ncbi:MAG: WG repeat-containing protein [Oscillospiraceae bacterium]|nr:WG repeat-containing protein [Oscillospiraceae bacterium]
MKRRILSLALAAALYFSALPAAAAETRGKLETEELVPPRYEDAATFSEGYAAVKQNGKWGYIDETGELVIPCRYERAYDFSEGYAVVSPNVTERNVFELANGSSIEYNYYDLGRIDAAGNYVPFYYMDPQMMESHPVTVPDIFQPSELVYHNGFVMVTIPGKGGQLFDAAGRSLVLAGDLDHVTGPLNEGLAPAEGRMEGLVGWVNARGEVVHKFYMEASGGSVDTFIAATLPFNQGIAPVWQCTTDWNTGESSYLLGFMDRSFRWVVQPQYTAYWRSGIYTNYEIFGETGLAMVAKGGRYGAIDRQGQTVIPFRYEILGAASDGLILFRDGGKYGYLDAESGEVAIEAKYMNASAFSGGLAAVWDGRSAFLIDRAGRSYADAAALDRDVYFRRNEDSSEVAFAPDEIVVIREGELRGYAHLRYTPPAPSPEELDAWAYEEVSAAVEAGLVPVDLQCLYRQDISRGEFCALAMELLCRAAGEELETLVKEKSGKSLAQWRRERPFEDASADEVIAAYALGVVSGRSEGVFAPYDGIRRREAALMLANTAKAAGARLSGGEVAFDDGNNIGAWAAEAVAFVYGAGIMLGTSASSFGPLEPYTREQSYMTALRLYEYLQENAHAGN